MHKKIGDLLPKWKGQIDDFSKQFKGLILSCSGGTDSTALLHVFCEKLKVQKYFFTSVFHVNYGLRGEASDGDEAFVKDLGRRFGVAVEVLEALQENDDIPTQGVQEWARDVRRAAYEGFAAKGFLVVCGHHLDDLKETVLHRLARGASVGRLEGMREYAHPLWRPFIGLPKEALVTYLIDENCSHRHDASNDKIDYRRNFIRHRILPELEKLHQGAGDKLVETAKEARDLADYCRKNMQSALKSVHFQPPIAFFRGLPTAVAYIALEEMIAQASGSGHAAKLSRAKLRQIAEKLETPGVDWHLDIAKQLIFKVKDDIASVGVLDASQKVQRYEQHRKNLQTNTMGAFLEQKESLEYWWPREDESKTKINSTDGGCTLIVKPFQGN